MSTLEGFATATAALCLPAVCTRSASRDGLHVLRAQCMPVEPLMYSRVIHDVWRHSAFSPTTTNK